MLVYASIMSLFYFYLLSCSIGLVIWILLPNLWCFHSEWADVTNWLIEFIVLDKSDIVYIWRCTTFTSIINKYSCWLDVTWQNISIQRLNTKSTEFFYSNDWFCINQNRKFCNKTHYYRVGNLSIGETHFISQLDVLFKRCVLQILNINLSIHQHRLHCMRNVSILVISKKILHGIFTMVKSILRRMHHNGCCLVNCICTIIFGFLVRKLYSALQLLMDCLGRNTSNFTASKDLFSRNSQFNLWRFEVIYGLPSEISSSALDFAINQPPSNGSCSINPFNGTTSTIFHVFCTDWFDKNGIKEYSLYGVSALLSYI